MTARAAALALLVALPAAARSGAPEPIRHDFTVDASITAAAAAAWLGTELANSHLVPGACRVCGGNAVDDRVRDALVWSKPDAARRASDLVFALIPVAALGQDLLAARAAGDAGAAGVDALVIAEAVAIAADLNQLAKLAVARRRPFVRFGDYADPTRRPTPDDDLSFYSGHTSLAFAFVAAAATVASLRGYPGAPWVWGVGLGLATAVGYFRMAGDMHYLTDVLAGAAVGVATGIAVPRLLHPREGAAAAPAAPRIVVTPFPIGVAVAF